MTAEAPARPSLGPTAADWLGSWEEYRRECKARGAWLEGSDEVIYQSVVSHVPAIQREAVLRGLELVADRVAQVVWSAVAAALRSPVRGGPLATQEEASALADVVRIELERWWEGPNGLPAYLDAKLGPAPEGTVP